MNERDLAKNKVKQNQEIVKAVIGIFLLLFIFTFYIFYKKSDSVSTKNESDISQSEKIIYSSDILQNYNQKVEAIKNSPEFETLKKNLDNSLIKEIESKVKVPENNFKPFKVSETYNKQKYGKEYIANFKNATTSGMGLEIVYFISQLSGESGEVMDLSKKDIEDIYNIANVYDKFADNIQKLETPLEYKQIAENTIQKSREISYYLKEMMTTTDPYLYSYIFNKYTEASLYIFKASENNIDKSKNNSDKDILKLLQNISSTTKNL